MSIYEAVIISLNNYSTCVLRSVVDSWPPHNHDGEQFIDVGFATRECFGPISRYS